MTNFVYNGQRIIEERVAGLTSAQYIYGLGVDEVLWSSSAQSYYYLTDGLGSVRQITDATGIVLQWYNYDVFGAPTVANPVNQSRFEFAGREYDPETGLYHYRARAYSPVLGRYLQRDPIGFADDYNLYRYVKNNPINFTDPSGLEGQALYQGTLGFFQGTQIGGETTTVLGIAGIGIGLYTGVPEAVATGAGIVQFSQYVIAGSNFAQGYITNNPSQMATGAISIGFGFLATQIGSALNLFENVAYNSAAGRFISASGQFVTNAFGSANTAIKSGYEEIAGYLYDQATSSGGSNQ